MDLSKLNQAEIDQLIDIEAKADYNFTIDVKDHFNRAGKTQDLINAVTPTDVAEQKKLMGGIFAAEPQSSYSSIKIKDIFIRAVRRIGTDDEIAGYLPKNSFTKSDIALMQKCGLADYAAVASKVAI
jgi:hypothetical protein